MLTPSTQANERVTCGNRRVRISVAQRRAGRHPRLNGREHSLHDRAVRRRSPRRRRWQQPKCARPGRTSQVCGKVHVRRDHLQARGDVIAFGTGRVGSVRRASWECSFMLYSIYASSISCVEESCMEKSMVAIFVAAALLLRRHYARKSRGRRSGGDGSPSDHVCGATVRDG
jgi:hypothetical protein